MINFNYDWQTKILFGRNRLSELCETLNLNDYRNVLILHDSGDYLEFANLLPSLRKELKLKNISFFEEGDIQPNPTLARIEEIIRENKSKNIDFILAVGGGSVIDSAKITALGLYNDIDLKEIFEPDVLIENAVPIGVILTIASSGSETSDAAIINIDETRKRAINSDLIIPKVAVLNPEYTFSLPAYQTAAGGCDIIFHTLERYFSPSDNTILTDAMGEGLMKVVMLSLNSVLNTPDDYNHRSNLMWAGTLSHNGILGTGKEEDWGLHMIGHELSGNYPVTHGASLCAIWGSWARFVYPKRKDRFLQFATNVMGVINDPFDEESVILQGILRFEGFIQNTGMPTRISELGLDLRENDLVKLAKSALENKKHIGNFAKLDVDDVLAILEMANK